MRRVCRGLVLGAALLATGALSAAMAQTVPLPTPAPLKKEGAAAQPSARAAQPSQSPGDAITSTLKSLFHLDKDPEPPAASTNLSGFNAAQRAQVDKVSAY